MKQIGEDLLKNVNVLNKLDQEIGDGDNGSTISRFASGTLSLYYSVHIKSSYLKKKWIY